MTYQRACMKASLLAFTLIAWPLASIQAAVMSSSNYQVKSYVIGGGGGAATSANYQLKVTAIGQSMASAVDESLSASYRLSVGYLHTLPDTDGDRVIDLGDNCTLVVNPNQRDTDSDGYGNLCDADLNNNGSVNTLDFGLFKLSFGHTGTGLNADFNGDGRVNTLDFGRFKQMFGKPVGPSGIAP